MEIDKSAVQAELECILNSRCFRSRKILQRLLTYLVTQALANNSPPITQYAIAVEGLGKSADFNASTDPVIRIQVGRLRKQLEEYYATEGRFDPLCITLPIRSYQAVFTPQRLDTHHLPVVAEALTPSLSQGPSIVCIPRTFSSDEASSWPFITRLARDYVTALTRFNFCQVLFADETPWQQTHWPDDAWHQYGADFALFLDLHNEAAGYSLKCSLVHSISHQAIWAHIFPLGDNYPAASTLHTIFKRIANDTLNYERGVAHDYWARWLLDSGKPIAPHHQVMLALRQQQWALDVNTFNQVLRTCEQRLEQHPHDVQAMLVYADMYRTEYLLKYNAMLVPVTYVAQVVDTLMQLAPGNAYSHLYLAGFHLLTGNQDLCLEALAQAQAINSLDTHLNATTGLIYTGLGDWHTGVSYIQDSKLWEDVAAPEKNDEH